MIKGYSQLLDELRETNRRFRCLADILCAAPESSRTFQGQTAGTEPISELLRELQCAAKLFSSFSNAKGTTSIEQTASLHDEIQQLREILPCVHKAVLVQQTLLEQQRRLLAGASEWMQLSRQIL